jgi:hypothetical protein
VTPLVIRWFEANWPRSAAVEVKVKGNKPLPHQEEALRQVRAGTFAWKIRDMGSRNPFDFFMLKGADAFVVTCDGRKCRAEGTSTFDFQV